MGSMPLATLDTESLIDGHIVSFSFRNNLALWYNRFLKRTVDLICTLLGIIVISPILMGICLWIKKTLPARLSSNIAVSDGTGKPSTAINSAACVSMPMKN